MNFWCKKAVFINFFQQKMCFSIGKQHFPLKSHFSINKIFFSVRNCSKNRLLTQIYQKFWKFSLIFKLKFWALRSAEWCVSCRSRRELFKKYFIVKFGADTAENGPSNFWIYFIFQQTEIPNTNLEIQYTRSPKLR